MVVNSIWFSMVWHAWGIYTLSCQKSHDSIETKPQSLGVSCRSFVILRCSEHTIEP